MKAKVRSTKKSGGGKKNVSKTTRRGKTKAVDPNKVTGKGTGGDGKTHGKKSGLPQTEFYVKMLRTNEKEHLSDTKLVQLIAREFPNRAGKSFDENWIQSVRAAYNRGRFETPPKPTLQSRRFDKAGKPAAVAKGRKATTKKKTAA